MAEYIEREALRTKATYMHGFGKNKYVPLRAIEEAPAADVVAVVRCKDCKHMEIVGECNGRYCHSWGLFNGAGDDGFCNYGERRESNG